MLKLSDCSRRVACRQIATPHLPRDGRHNLHPGNARYIKVIARRRFTYADDPVGSCLPDVAFNNSATVEEIDRHLPTFLNDDL